MPLDTKLDSVNSIRPGNTIESLDILRKTKIALAIMSIVAVIAISGVLFLYLHTFPQLIDLRQKVEAGQEQLRLQQDIISKDCVKLATEEFNLQAGDGFKRAIATIAQCKDYFRQDALLPQYEAEISVRHFLDTSHDPNDLKRAQSSAAQSNGISPNYLAYEWSGIAYCAQSLTPSSVDRESFVNSAVQAFQSEFSLEPQRKQSLRNNYYFGHYCPQEVQRRLYP